MLQLGYSEASRKTPYRPSVRRQVGFQEAAPRRISRNRVWPIVALGALGFLFPGQLHLVLIPLAAVVVWALWSRASQSEWSRPMLVAVTIGVFVAGTVVRDVVVPPVANCANGSYTYSATSAGACAADGGVKQWMPTPWWMQ